MTPAWKILLISAVIPITAAVVGLIKRKQSGLGQARISDFEPSGIIDSSELDRWNLYFRKPTKDDGDCLYLGKQHGGRYAFGTYRLCLTKNQKKTLFKSKIGKKLGCGTFACAYAQGPNKVVKFTRDSEDVAALIKAQSLGVVPKVYDTFKLKQEGVALPTGDRTKVYAMVIERLTPIRPEDREELDGRLSMIPDIMAGYSYADELCGEEAGDTISCGTLRAAEKLKDAGIVWNDTHSGNIGLDKQGNVKILDLGVTGTQLKKNPKILAGAHRRLASIAGVLSTNEITLTTTKAYRSWWGDRAWRADLRGSRPEGQCYPWAFKQTRPGALLVHGTVQPHGGKWGKQAYSHAWVERGGRVYDWQSAQGLGPGPKGWPREQFYEVYRPVDVETYDHEIVRKRPWLRFGPNPKRSSG